MYIKNILARNEKVTARKTVITCKKDNLFNLKKKIRCGVRIATEPSSLQDQSRLYNDQT